jgi:hypothetical protein
MSWTGLDDGVAEIAAGVDYNGLIRVGNRESGTAILSVGPPIINSR